MGRSRLLLTQRVEHLDHFSEKLRGFVQNIIVLRGGMGSKQRLGLADQIKTVLDSGERVILSTGRYIGEGFDEPDWTPSFYFLEADGYHQGEQYFITLA